jgi:hypothetical protein
MFEWLVPTGSVLVAAGVGWLTYIVANRTSKADAASTLFDDASALKDDYKEAYLALKREIGELRDEIAELRVEMSDCGKWEGVAVAVTTEFHEETGFFPLAWPDSEAHPACPQRP